MSNPIVQERVSGEVATIVLYWKNDMLAASNLMWKEDQDSETKLSSFGQYLKRYLLSYEKKEPQPWKIPPLDWSVIPQRSFQKNVLWILSKLPYGGLTTYGELAKQAGSPRAARAVGSIMAKNPWPFILPCHRVIATNGKLAGFTNNGGLSMKRWLLCQEGHAKTFD